MAERRVSRVVVGYDGSSAGDAALDAATAEAAARDVPLRVMTVVEPVAYTAEYRRLSEETAARAGARAGAVLGPARVEHTTEVGDPAAELLAACRPDDLLVVGTHGHRPVARVLLGSTSTTVSAHAPCAVLVVRGARVRRTGPVVVGVDGSAGSVAAVAYAAELAAREQTGLTAVLALPPTTDAMGFVTGPYETQVEAARQLLSQSVAAGAKDHPEVPVTTVVVQTHPVEALLRHARDARVVVVGSRGHGALASLVIGSVSREMLQHSPAPVVVVRTEIRREHGLLHGGGRKRGLVDA